MRLMPRKMWPTRRSTFCCLSVKRPCLRVRDNGHGITDLDNLFEPFYTTKKPGEGVGLGLAISSGIVSDLGGRLTARNADDGGAVFEVQLPITGQRNQSSGMRTKWPEQ